MYVRLLGLLPLLASCSLINSYDDVVEGGAGAGNAGGGEPTTTTGTETTSTGMGGDNSGGGGGAPVAPLDCQLVVLPDEVTNLGGEPQGQRTFRDRGFAWQSSGDRIRMAVMVGDEIRGYEIATTSGTLTGQSWVLDNVDDMIDSRRVGDGGGLLVVRRPATFGDPFPVELHFVGGQGFGNVSMFPIASHASDENVRGKFFHVGPEPNRIDLLLRTKIGTTSNVFFVRHDANGNNSPPIPFTPTMPFQDFDDSSPEGLLRTSGNRIHAFVGEPDPEGKSVKHFVFNDSAAETGPEIPLGTPGMLFLDAEPSGPLFNVAMARITMTTLGAQLGKLTEAQLDNFSTDNLHPAKQFDSFLDIPTSGRPTLLGDMLPLFGPNQTKTEFMLILSRTTDGAVRFDDPDFLQPKSPNTIFGDVGLVVTDDPVINLGGVLYILYTERENAGEMDEFDRLMMATVTCEPES